jgi:uncharacterized spore protein YtfJ
MYGMGNYGQGMSRACCHPQVASYGYGGGEGHGVGVGIIAVAILILIALGVIF